MKKLVTLKNVSPLSKNDQKSIGGGRMSYCEPEIEEQCGRWCVPIGECAYDC